MKGYKFTESTTIVVPKTVKPSVFFNSAAIKAAFESVVPEINCKFLFNLSLFAKP